ncbi:endonuclease III [Candidatus Dojkabacteria bacterium]|nr:endonuclease III [Candidatus Dojkabacteria bacterium]
MNKVELIYQKLSEVYPKASGTLEYRSPSQFLFINILSPQCTDKVVNKVSKALWKKFETVEKIASAKLRDIQNVIRPVGFFIVKSRYIRESARLLMSRYNFKLPSTIKELRSFPGIGRKTALVILQKVFNRSDGVIVDTHHIRIVNRIGIIRSKSPIDIENFISSKLPRSKWFKWSSFMVFHGRNTCIARNPKCANCSISHFCNFGLSANHRGII